MEDDVCERCHAEGESGTFKHTDDWEKNALLCPLCIRELEHAAFDEACHQAYLESERQRGRQAGYGGYSL